jgi:hypothetical protein
MEVFYAEAFNESDVLYFDFNCVLMASSLCFLVAAVLPAILCIHGIKGQRKLVASPYKSKPKFKGSVAHYQQGLSKSSVCRFIPEDNHWTV